MSDQCRKAFEEWWFENGISGQDNEWSARTAWQAAWSVAQKSWAEYQLAWSAVPKDTNKQEGAS